MAVPKMLPRLRVTAALATSPVPEAVGLPDASSEAEAVPQAADRVTITALSGGIRQAPELSGDGTAFPLAAFCTAVWVVEMAWPVSTLEGEVGQGFVLSATVRHKPVPSASADGLLVASASEAPPARPMVLSRLSEMKPPSAFTFHVLADAPALPAMAVTSIAASTPTVAIRMRPFMTYPFHSSATPRKLL